MTDLDEKLPRSGLTVREAIRRAQEAWDNRWRRLIRKEVNEDQQPGKVLSGGGAPSVIIPGKRAAVLQSGILRGLPWDELTNAERHHVVRVWHDFHVAHELGEPHKDTERLGLETEH